MCSAPLSPSAKAAIRARRAAVRSCASAMAFASDGDGEGAKGASFCAVAKKDAPLAPSPSPSEAKAIADAQERTAARRARIAALAEGDNGALHISPPHSDDAGFAARLLDAFGTESPAF